MTLTFEWVLAKSAYCAYLIGVQESHWAHQLYELFHTNLSSAIRLAASHSNPMSNSFIFIMEIQVICCLPLGFFVCLRKYWSAIFARVSSKNHKRWPNQLCFLLVITWDQGICLVTAQTVSLVAIFGHLTLRIALFSNLRWNESIVFSSVCRSRNCTKIHCSHTS